MNAEYIRTVPLEELLPFVKAELKAAKLWREEYEPEGRRSPERFHRPMHKVSKREPRWPSGRKI